MDSAVTHDPDACRPLIGFPVLVSNVLFFGLDG
jgi:hypothetical protein